MGGSEQLLAVLPRYTRRAASSRVRQFGFLDRLAADGRRLAVQPLLPDSYLDRIYGRRRRAPYGQIAMAYARRAMFMARLPYHSIAWVEKELFPKWPVATELAALRRVRTFVLDLDDAWFLTYGDAEAAGRNKISMLIRRADIVTVANRTMALEAERRGARAVRIFGPCVDTARFSPAAAGRKPGGPPVIGWIGTPLNAEKYLPRLVPVLNKLTAEGRARVVLVGAGAAIPALDAERREWSEDTEGQDVGGFDIGIMPLSDTPWDRCKSGLKLLQTMACGGLAIGSAVGFNSELLRDGENGILVPAAADAAEETRNWAAALDRALADGSLRRRLGAMGRETVLRNFDAATREGEISEFFVDLALRDEESEIRGAA